MHKFDKPKEHKFDNEHRKIDHNTLGVILWNSDFTCS